MTRIERSAVVGYTPRQMFELVNNIQDYPRFLTWCRTGRILAQADAWVEASLEIAWSGLRKSFTTRNTLHVPDRMDIRLVSGPFRRLEGHWQFQPVGETGCRVSLELEFELTGHFLDRLFQPVFWGIANSLVEAFCRRAGEVYGTHPG